MQAPTLPCPAERDAMRDVNVRLTPDVSQLGQGLIGASVTLSQSRAGMQKSVNWDEGLIAVGGRTGIMEGGEESMRPKIFGIGLSRTGTTSLTEALRLLGYKAVHCPLSLVSLHGQGLTLSHDVIRRFDAFTDSPVACMYRELDETFPGSKFILTTRPLEKWMNSVRRMRMSFELLKLLPKVRRLAKELCGTTSFSDDSVLERAFCKHGAQVREYFGDRLDKDLLVLDVGAPYAWENLCAFLGHDRPHIAFPHYNRGYATTYSNMRDLIRHSWPLT